MEAQNVFKPNLGDDEVVVAISGAEEVSKMKENTVLELSVPSSSGMTTLSPLPSHIPKPISARGLRRRPLCPIPKSRLVEPPYPRPAKVVDDQGNAYDQSSTANASSSHRYESSPTMHTPYNGGTGAAGKESKRTDTSGSISPTTALITSPGGNDEEDDDTEDDDDVYMAAGLPEEDQFEVKKRRKGVKFFTVIEWIAFGCIVGILIASLCINKLKNSHIWELNLWKWFVLALAVFCGHLVAKWFMNLIAFIIKTNLFRKNKVLYFLYGLRESVCVFVWLALILLAWALLINRGVDRSRRTTRVMNYITRGIASSLISAVLWVVKTLLVMLSTSSFHVETFFIRIQESIFHQYVLKVLSGPPILNPGGNSINMARLSIKQKKKLGIQKGSGEEVIDVDKLYKMKKEQISAWTIGGLIKVIRSSGLSTFSELQEQSQDNEGVERKEIRSEFEAVIAAEQIYKKVAKTSNKYIEEQDLLLYMPQVQVDHLLQMFGEGAETGKIRKEEFENWMVKVYHERKYLQHSLDDSKTAIVKLDKIASVILLVIILIVWLLMMGLATTHALVVISSQIVLAAFMFGQSARTLFEALIFIFVKHPFDVGDKCVVDGVEMTVEEMNILTTIFLRYDNQKIYYPNDVLATVPISNVNRSPEMRDKVEFSVDFSVPVESIAAFKARIKEYLESKSTFWRPDHTLAIKAIEDLTKLKMELSVTHTVNFQESSEIANRRSDLLLQIKRIFEELDIQYHPSSS